MTDLNFLVNSVMIDGKKYIAIEEFERIMKELGMNIPNNISLRGF